MQRIFLRWSAAAALVVALGGCASAGLRARANVSLMSARPVASTVFESTVELTLRVTNPGDTPLMVSGGAHELSLNGTVVGRGVSNARVTVPAFTSVEVPATVYVENLVLLRKGRDLPKLAAVSYEIATRWAGAEGASGFTSRATGTLDLRSLMEDMELDWTQLAIPQE
jgi:hypothetical protein